MQFLAGAIVGGIVTLTIMCMCILSGTESKYERKRDAKYGVEE